MNVREYYYNVLEERGYEADEAQVAVIERLQTYYDEWVVFKHARSTRLKKLFRRPDVPRGVYMWGGVGRGKSFLMDAFYLTVPVKRKTRIHFHEFMRGVHHQLDEVRGQEDPLDEVAKRIARRYRLICFDEFHVSDVADAMILYRLLFKLFELGTSFVMTSNYEPSTLYPDGLHRDRILPAIKLIQERMDILNVDVGLDYRRRSLEQVRMYLTPITEATNKELQANFDRLLDTAPLKPVLTIENRQVKA
ncbi:MAG TPA: cell division protein ZapE, partial [Burkholderiaceae bacterium]|nr:cell division protein ZapE [Burkholderiaceae bacterium]